MAVASAGPYASLHLAPDRQPRQYPTTLFFTGQMPFLPPNQQRQSTEGTVSHQKKSPASDKKTDLRQTDVGLSCAGQQTSAASAGCAPLSSSRSTFITLVSVSHRHTTIHKHACHCNITTGRQNRQLRSSDTQN